MQLLEWLGFTKFKEPMGEWRALKIILEKAEGRKANASMAETRNGSSGSKEGKQTSEREVRSSEGTA